MAIAQANASQRTFNALDSKIAAIQKSTKTSIPSMLPAHDWMRQRSKLYYNWHLLPYASTIHWVALVVTFLGVIVGVTISYYIV